MIKKNAFLATNEYYTYNAPFWQNRQKITYYQIPGKNSSHTQKKLQRRNIFVYAEPQGRHSHWPSRSHDPKGLISLALGSWRWGGGEEVPGRVGGGMGTGNERERGGIFFTADLC